MDELMKNYENKLFTVFIDNVKYTAVFRCVEDELGFEINHCNNISFNIIKRKINIIEGLIEDREITILSPMVNTYSSEKIIFKFDMMLDGFLLGKNKRNRKIKSIECSYYGVNEFSQFRFIDFNTSGTLKENFQKDSFNLENGILSFIRTNRIVRSKDSVTINKIYIFKHDYINKVSIYEAVKDIWHLKNLFSIFSKKEIGVQNIKVFYNDDVEANLFMNCVKKPEHNYKNELLEIEEKRFLIHYEKIKENFDVIYRKSCECFERIEPILQIYLDSLEKEMPKLNRFLSFCQMIEGFSREYYEKESLNEMIQSDLNKKNKKEPELKYRIRLLIKNVKFIYNFKDNKRIKISEKISLGRNYYIHHDKNKKINQLSGSELFRYTYFLEDILLANIYLQLGIDKNVIKEAFRTPFYYEISDL